MDAGVATDGVVTLIFSRKTPNDQYTKKTEHQKTGSAEEKKTTRQTLGAALFFFGWAFCRCGNCGLSALCPQRRQAIVVCSRI
jgi:hypothetical protein